jgi:two-component system, OmpR family, heavy metal sensor histidine kinase CusS
MSSPVPTRTSFRLRLALQTTLIAGLIVGIFGVGAWLYARHQLALNLDLRITETGRRLWTQLTPRSVVTDFAKAQQDLPQVQLLILANAGDHRLIYSNLSEPPLSLFKPHLPTGPSVATLPSNEPLRRPQSPLVPSYNQRPQMAEIRLPVFFTAAVGAAEYRFGAFSSPFYTVFVGVGIADFYAEVWHAAYLLSAAALALLTLAGVGAWWSAGRALRPLDRIIHTTRALRASDLGIKIPLMPRDDLEFAEIIAVLNDMMQRLEVSFQQAARFSADASHELKTPLAVIQSLLQEALRESQPETPMYEHLSALLHEVSRLKSITQALLTLSQADAGKIPLNLQRYDLSEDLRGLVEDAELLCEGAGLSFRADIQPGLEITADRTLMRQVFQNLLTNAVKYNQPQGRVELTLMSHEDVHEFTILNTGPGIDETQKARLFERFFRADTARHTEGSGLGLNIAYELAKANAASLSLLSSDAYSTIFTVRLSSR